MLGFLVFLGRKMIKEPINLNTKFHSEVIQIVVDCSDKVHWKKLARRLDMQHNSIENIEHDHKSEPIGEQCYQMLVDWTRRTGLRRQFGEAAFGTHWHEVLWSCSVCCEENHRRSGDPQKAG